MTCNCKSAAHDPGCDDRRLRDLENTRIGNEIWNAAIDEAVKVAESFHRLQPNHGPKCWCVLAAGLVHVTAEIKRLKK